MAILARHKVMNARGFLQTECFTVFLVLTTKPVRSSMPPKIKFIATVTINLQFRGIVIYASVWWHLPLS